VGGSSQPLSMPRSVNASYESGPTNDVNLELLVCRVPVGNLGFFGRNTAGLGMTQSVAAMFAFTSYATPCSKNAGTTSC